MKGKKLRVFSYETTFRNELNKAVKKMIDEGRPFSFSKKVCGMNEFYVIKIKFVDVEVAEDFWHDLNRECDSKFSFGYRRQKGE